MAGHRQARSVAGRAGTRIAEEPDFDFRSDEYRELFAESDATAFQHPVWLDAFYRTLLEPHRARKLVVTGRDEASGRLCFVLPLLCRRQAGVDLIEAAHLGVGDYAHPVVRTGWQPRPDLFDAIVAVMPAHDVLNIRPIRKKAVSRWLGLLRARTRPLDYCAHAVDLEAPFEQWRARRLDRGFLKSLDRKKRRFLETGKAELTRVRRPAEIAAAIEEIARLRAGRFDDDRLQTELFRRFYAAVAADGVESGFSRAYRLTLDGELVAVTFGLTHGGRFYSLLVGADYARFGRHSPGVLLDDMVIEDWLSDGGEIFDFTIGDEAYKKEFGTAPSAIHALLEPASFKGAVAVACFDAMRAVQRSLASPTFSPATAFRRAEGALRRLFVKIGTTFVLVVRPIMAECVACI